MNSYSLTAGILSPLENLLEDLLIWLHSAIGLPWAWAIIALTAIVRLVIFPITAKQTRSSLALQRLAPYTKQLQQKYKDDRAALNQAIMEFYRDNRVNPMASCLPILLQLPIFLALFFVLKDFQAPAGASTDYSFLFGFVDDIRTAINKAGISGWILLLFYVASQMLSTITMMTSPNPQQKILFLLMPIIFVPFILRFPIGVMLYWITTNLWSLFQYLLVVNVGNKNPEIILPSDSRGRKKAIVPKSEKGKGGNASKKKGADKGQAANNPAARKNRRRK